MKPKRSHLRQLQSPQGQNDIPGLPVETPLKLTSRGSSWPSFHFQKGLGFARPEKAPADLQSDRGKTGAAENQAGSQLELRRLKSVSFIKKKKSLCGGSSVSPSKF